MSRPAARSALAGVVAAGTAALLCCGTVSPALAAAGPAAKDPLAAVRAKALVELAIDTRQLSAIGKAGATSRLLSADEQDALGVAVIEQGAALRDDRVAVARARNKVRITTAAAAGRRTVAAAVLELSASLAAEAHLAPGQRISNAAGTLSDEAQDAAAAGDDTTDLTTALDAVQVDLESAQGDESSAFGDVMGLDAAPSAAALATASTHVTGDLAVVDQDLSDARDDLAAAQDAYDALAPQG